MQVNLLPDDSQSQSIFTDFDLYLISEGRHEQLWQVLGSHVRENAGTSGVNFAVWAPNAQAVRVMGDFNGWNSEHHAMGSLGRSGIWELFIPQASPGQYYKYEIQTTDGSWKTNADPMAFATELPPANASRVYESSYAWNDSAWLIRRADNNPHVQPTSVYEVHIGSWKPGLGYRELATELVNYVVDLGYTHVEFMPVAEHPYAPSWGYQVTSYYAPSSRFGEPDDFRFLVDALHQAGIGVIVDWVPAHFPKDAWALARFDGTALYEHEDPHRGEHPDWGTYVFNFGRKEVRNFLTANALYWLKEYHIDALRVDAVSSMLYLDYSREEGEWTPNEFGGREYLEAVSFLQEVNAMVYAQVPGAMMIAEESTAWGGVTAPTNVGGLGFGLKWNMGWMHDSLEYMKEDPIHRRYHHSTMTFSLVYAWSENYVLPLSHDEVVHGKGSLYTRMPGDHWQKLANLRAYLAFMWAHPGKKLLFMGGDFGQQSEWNSGQSLDWHLVEQDESHRGVQATVRAMNAIYKSQPALWERDNEPGGFQWLIVDGGEDNVFAWLRSDHNGQVLVSVTNLSPVVRHDYRLGVPSTGDWVEVLNTDCAEFGGSDVRNESVLGYEGSVQGQPAHISVTLAPLATLWFVLKTER